MGSPPASSPLGNSPLGNSPLSNPPGVAPQNLGGGGPVRGGHGGAPVTQNPFARPVAGGVSPAGGLGGGKPAAGKPNVASGKSKAASLGGLAAAAAVAVVATVVWLIIAAVTGRELGVLAWGIGGLIGLIAGLIARNPSPAYCGGVAAIALMSVVGAKLIMAIAVMFAGRALGFTAELGQQFDPEINKSVRAQMDQDLADGNLTDDEAAYAKTQISEFFGGEYEDGELTETQSEAGEALEERIRQSVQDMSQVDRETLVSAARERHPEWIEDRNHYLAVMDSMVEAGEIEESLVPTATASISPMNGEYDSEYSRNISPNERERLNDQLEKLVTTKMASLTMDQRDEAVRQSMRRHPTWNPYPDAMIATVDEMLDAGQLDGQNAETARRWVALTMDNGEDWDEDESDDFDYEEYSERQKEVQRIASPRVAELDSPGRQKIIDEAKTRHPQWVPQSATPAERMEAMKRRLTDGEDIDLDGTFVGALKTVCSPIDALWLFLCGTTAFTTARQKGTPKEK